MPDNNKPKRDQEDKKKLKVGSRTTSTGARGSGQVRLTPKHRETIDSSVIALAYFLIASRIVEEAEQHGDLDCPDPETHPGEPE